MSQENPRIYELDPLGSIPSLLDEFEGQGLGDGISYKTTLSDMLGAYLGPKAFNLVSTFQADSTGVSACGQIFKNAIESLPQGSTLIIPPGDYNGSDLLADITLNQSRVSIIGLGFPKINLNGKSIVLGASVGDFTCEGVWFTNGSITPSASTNVLDRFRFCNNKFTDCVGTGDRIAVNLNIAMTNCFFFGNHFSNIQSTNQANAKAAVLGLRDTGNLFLESYNFYIAGNTFTSISTNATDNTGAAIALSVFGRQVRINDNLFSSISHASTNTANNSTAAVWAWGHEIILDSNNFEDAGTHQYLTLQAGTNASPSVYGTPGRMLVTGNTFRSRSQQSIRNIYVLGYSSAGSGKVQIKNNFFERPYTVGNGVIEVTPVSDNVDIEDNAVYGGYYTSFAHITGSSTVVKRNFLSDPFGPANPATTWNAINLRAGAATSNVYVEENDVTIGSSWAPTSNSARVVNIYDNGYDLTNVYVRQNKLNSVTIGMGTTWSVTRLETSSSRTHTNLVFEDNENDGELGAVDQPTLFDTNSVASGQVLTALHSNIFARTSNYTVQSYQTGMVFSNDGAGGTVILQLPMAVPGMSFTFFRKTAQILQVEPYVNDTIHSGGAGKYMNLTNFGMVTISCYEINSWVITNITCVVSFEP